MCCDSLRGFGDDHRREITAEQVTLSHSAASGVVRAIVALDAGPCFVVEFNWQDLATMAALLNCVFGQGSGALCIVTFMLNRLCGRDLDRWIEMSYDDRALELVSQGFPIASA